MTLRPVLLIAALACAAPAAAQPTQPAPAASQQQDTPAIVSAWLQEVVPWARAYQGLVQDNAKVFEDLVSGAEKATEYFQSRDRHAGATWARDWGREQREAFAALKAKAAAFPAPPKLPDIAGIPEWYLARYASLSQTKPAIERMTATTAELGEQYIVSIEQVAGGSKEAVPRLVALTSDSALAVLRGENAVLETTSVVALPGHPQLLLLQGQLDINNALIAFLELQRADFAGETVDRPAHIARMRELAQSAAIAAGKVPAASKTALGTVDRATFGADLHDRVVAAFGTYEDSAGVEAEVAEVVKQLAARLEAGDETTSDESLKLLDQLTALVDKRVALDVKRRNLLANVS